MSKILFPILGKLLQFLLGVALVVRKRALENKCADGACTMSRDFAIQSLVDAAKEAIDQLLPTLPAYLRPIAAMLNNGAFLLPLAEQAEKLAEDTISWAIESSQKLLTNPQNPQPPQQ